MDQLHGLKERLAQAERGSVLADSRVADERTRRQEVEAEAAALRKQIEFVERNLATAESRIHDLTRANEDLQRRHQFELDRARQGTSFERQGELVTERRVFRETLDELRREMQTLVRTGAERAPENRLGATAAEQARAASRLRESVRTANRKAADQAHIMNLLDKLSKNLPEIVE
jgi:chromosome segregation ATPase